MASTISLFEGGLMLIGNSAVVDGLTVSSSHIGGVEVYLHVGKHFYPLALTLQFLVPWPSALMCSMATRFRNISDKHQ
jgi:hypothetical protein